MNYLQAWDGAMYPPHVVAAALIEQYRDAIWHYGWRNRQPTGVAHGIGVVQPAPAPQPTKRQRKPYLYGREGLVDWWRPSSSTSQAQAPASAPAKGAGSSSPVLVDA